MTDVVRSVPLAPLTPCHPATLSHFLTLSHKRMCTHPHDTQVLLDKTRSFVAAWAAQPPGSLIDDVNDWLTCMTADAVTKAAMGLVSCLKMRVL